jgi:hypothetical protein
MNYEPFYESDGEGELGACMGFNVDGHLDFQQVEEFMATVAPEYFGDEWRSAPLRGFDVRHQWVRKVPREWGHVYQYQNVPGRGAKAVTRIEEETTWEERCHNHPFEVARSGFHEATFVDGEGKGDDQKYIYFCADCVKRIDADREAARKKAMDDYYRQKAATT